MCRVEIDDHEDDYYVAIGALILGVLAVGAVVLFWAVAR